MSEHDDDDAGLDALRDKIQALGEQHRYVSQVALLREALTRAKAAKRLESTIHFLFSLANGGNSTLEPETQREASVELVALLESEAAARRIEPEVGDEVLAICKHYYTSCAYDNLALATGRLQGFNSPGMYDAISEGIAKCRETGKTECITCFREYGVSVSLAADDLGLASKQALALAQRDKELAQHDRRVIGWINLAWVQTLEGDLSGAIASLERGLEVSGDYHDPGDIQAALHLRLETLHALRGTADAYATFLETHPRPAGAPSGEDVDEDRLRAHLAIVNACVAGDYAEADAILVDWLAQHEARRHRAYWFDDAARRVAVLRLAGREEEARALAEEVGGRAQEARDWLTARRVILALDPDRPTNPLATVRPLREGPYAPADLPEDAPQDAPPETSEDAPQDAPPEAAPEPVSSEAVQELEGWFEEWVEGARSDEALLEAALGVLPTTVEEAEEAWWLLRMLKLGAGEEATRAQVLRHAGLLAKRFDDPPVQAQYAEVLDRAGEREPALERYTAAVEASPHDPQVNYLAGCAFARAGRFGEGERCLARAARLDRANGSYSLALAEVHRTTDRPGDACDALDLAIRAGCRDPRVAWEAGLSAFNVHRYRECVAYVDLLLALVDAPQPWAHYYRALSLLHLEEYAPALEALALEETHNDELAHAAHAIRADCLAGLDDVDGARAAVEAALSLPLREATRLTRKALGEHLERLHQTALKIDDAALVERAVSLALHAGLADDAIFKAERDAAHPEPLEEVAVFQVRLRQPLAPDHGDRVDCPAWEREGADYLVDWWVLAQTEDQAVELALQAQRRCGDLEPEQVEVQQTEPPRYTDKPGVIDHGYREVTPKST